MTMSGKIIEKINLIDNEKFIPIENKYYGGYQNWLFTESMTKKFWADRSCGVVAASHCAYYLSRYHNKPLYSYKDISLESFTFYLNEVSKFICPRVYGIPTLYHMKKGFIKFAKYKNIKVESKQIDIKLPKKTLINLLKKALKDNYPVMMITWNSKNLHLKNHWITITGFYVDEDNNNFIITSNWGKREVYNLDEWLKEKVIYKGLLYFK